VRDLVAGFYDHDNKFSGSVCRLVACFNLLDMATL
jgi:hypothetical protein